MEYALLFRAGSRRGATIFSRCEECWRMWSGRDTCPVDGSPVNLNAELQAIANAGKLATDTEDTLPLIEGEKNG